MNPSLLGARQPRAPDPLSFLRSAFDRDAHPFRELLDALPAAVYVTDAEGRITFYNEACLGFSGRAPAIGRDRWCVSWRMYRADGTPLPHEQCPMAQALREDRVIRGVEAIAERPDGTRVPFMPYPTPLHDAAGRLVGGVNMLVDITDRKRAEDAVQRVNALLEQRIEERTRQMSEAAEKLRASERRFRLLVESVTDYAIFMLDKTGLITNWNQGAQRIKGYAASEIVGRHFAIFYTPEDLADGMPERALKTAARDGRFEAEGWCVRKSGERFWANVVIDAIRDEKGEIIGFATTTRDVTERRKVEQALVESERTARAIVDTALDAFVQLDAGGAVREWNARAEELFGWTRHEAIGQPFLTLIVPPDQEAPLGDWLARLRREGDGGDGGERLQIDAARRDGLRITVELAITVLRRASGAALNIFIRDLTEKIANEAQLRQAQKMESIGQLTGGIAHDFNNLLAIIVPSLELAKMRLKDEGIGKYLESAMRAAERGADLTRQLLAFARKQDLAVKPVEVNRLVESVCDMLPRTLGPTVVIETRLAGDAGVSLTDPNQLELAILNLAINARDAMPDGGRLTIATERVPATVAWTHWRLDAGEYTMIAVVDTGKGMNEDVRSRAFEPFYTTKGVGKGSGLGLSMVYGFARQSGGNATLDSEPGKGTTVRLFLPRAQADEEAAQERGDDAPLDAGPRSRLLVVDDDDAVRSLTTSVVRDLGHEAVEASSGPAALALLRDDRAFDLMLVDVAMPQMQGTALAREARRIVPGMPVLFMSGYADPGVAGEAPPQPLLKKPFRRAELAAKLKSALAA